jgi:hypothetical protein
VPPRERASSRTLPRPILRAQWTTSGAAFAAPVTTALRSRVSFDGLAALPIAGQQDRRVRARMRWAEHVTTKARAALPAQARTPVRYMSVDPAAQRPTALQGDIRRDKENGPYSPEFAATGPTCGDTISCVVRSGRGPLYVRAPGVRGGESSRTGTDRAGGSGMSTVPRRWLHRPSYRPESRPLYVRGSPDTAAPASTRRHAPAQTRNSPLAKKIQLAGIIAACGR